MLTKSIYTLVFNSEDKYYLYNSRSNFFSEISPELYDSIENCDFKSLPQDVVTELKSREILVEQSDLYDYYYSRRLQFNASNNNRRRLALVIAPTTGCNFECPYCFEPKHNPKTMSDEVIGKIVEFVKDHKDAQELFLTWYGGEPLIAFNRIKQLYDALSQDGLPVIKSQTIITNGYCFTDDVIDFFKTHGCHNIQITIDGLYEKHDATRRLKGSTAPTFDRIILNIDRIVANLPDTYLSIRVNVDRENYLDFVEVYNYFHNRYSENKNINIYPGLIRKETDDNLTLCSSSFATSERLELNRLLREAGINTSDFPTRTQKGCMMHSQNSYVIGPEGELYKCWNDVSDPDAIIGYIDRENLTNESLFIKYGAMAIPFNSECRECHAFPICDGGCSYHRYRNMFEGCRFDLCSPYRDTERLKHALLSGAMPIQQESQQA